MKHICFAILLLASTAFAQEDRLISILNANSPPQEKSDACQELARIGTRKAVPVLASLLADEKLSHMARYALEPIADPAVDEALCDALGKVKGQLLVGVISSLGVGKDPAAIEALAHLLADADSAVVQAAARALGCIGGAAVSVLEEGLSTTSGLNQLAVCEGLIPSAEAIPGVDAAANYDKLRALPNFPLHLRVAALGGSILSRGSNGLPLPVESIRTEVLVPAADAIRISMELPGAEVTQDLVGELATANEQKQILLTHAIDQQRMLTATPTLTKASGDADAAVANASLKALHDIGGPVDAEFTPIFNGKDLSGWNGKPGWWTVEDGALTVESTPEKPCKKCNYLIWRGDHPTDFELLADFKLSSKANSGIQLRSEELLDWDTSGYQADMTGDGALVGFVYHHKRGLIAGRGEKASFAADGKKAVEPLGDPAELMKNFKQGDWNTYHVICRGPEITLSVNGVLMCLITDHHATQAATRGLIALQMHPGPPMKIQFKNIRLKRLKSDDLKSNE